MNFVAKIILRMNHLMHFFTQAQAKGSKSTVLAPLLYAIGLSFLATCTLNYYDSDPLFVGLCLAITGVFVLASVISYFICLFKDPDLLRSEKYLISKMEIEKSMIGDDRLGLIDMSSKTSLIIENDSSEGHL